MDMTPLLTAGPEVQLHVALAVLALTLGPFALLRARRDALHRWLGRVWIAAMLGTALSSLFIHEGRMFGPFSVIHILSVITLAGLGQGVWHLIRRDYRAHGRAMRALYVQALILAGIFTFLPGRRMNAALFGANPQAGFVVAVVLGLAALAAIWAAPGLRRSLRRN